MKQLDTKLDVENTMCSVIAKWFEISHVTLYKSPDKLHKAIWTQGAIGWRQNGKGHISSLTGTPKK